MAKIHDALYRAADAEFTISLRNITPKEYWEKYRGKLYCSTSDCSAMITYVMRTGNKSHFRTWRGTKHIENCDYYSEKLVERIGTRTTSVDFIFLDDDQMSRSMKEAYLQEVMTEEEKDLMKKKVAISHKRTTTLEKDDQISFELTTDPVYKNNNLSEKKARLYKRNVDAITNRDVGWTRTIIGEYVGADFSTGRPIVRIKKNEVYANILFEEAFFSENLAARERLSTIRRYADLYDSPIIVVVGEIRQNSVTNEFEIALFEYKAFRMDGRSLDAIAVGETIQQWEF